MKKGFTLIEVLVAIAIFSIVVMIAAGAFTRALQTQREVAALISAQSNGSLTLEQMSREVRTGYFFCATSTSTYANEVPSTPCVSPVCTVISNGNPGHNTPQEWQCSKLDFWNAHGCEIQYALSSGALTRTDAYNCEGNGAAAQPITSANVSVRSLSFVLFGNMYDDKWDARVTMAMGVAPSSTDSVIAGDVMNLQTTVSARNCGSTVGGC